MYITVRLVHSSQLHAPMRCQEAILVDEIFSLVTTAFSDVVSVYGHSPHELLFGQRVSDVLAVILDSDDILPANSESHEQRQERRRLALQAVTDSVSAAGLRRAAEARTRKYIAWQPGPGRRALGAAWPRC